MDKPKKNNLLPSDTKIIVLGSLAVMLVVLILSILFPNTSKNETTTATEAATTEAATEKPIVTGWQEIDGAMRYVRNDGKLAKSQWVDGHYVGSTGVMYTGTLTPDGQYVDAEGNIDESVGTTKSRKGLWELYRTLEEMVSGYYGTWSIYVKDIEHNEYLLINNVQHFSASLIKLY